MWCASPTARAPTPSRGSGATSSARCSPARWACIWRTGFSSTRTGPWSFRERSGTRRGGRSCSAAPRREGPPSAPLGRGDLLARRAHQRGHVLGQLAAQVLLAQVAVLVELSVGLHDRELAVDDLGADGAEHLAHLRLRPHRTEEAGAGADDGGGLAAQDVVRDR